MSVFLLIIIYIKHCLSNCNGCTSGGTSGGTNCYNMVDSKVYACRGNFSNGINSPSAQAICNTGYEVCPSISRLSELSLTSNLCSNINTQQEFYATLISSSGSAICDPNGYDGENAEDIWGCAKTGPTNSGSGVVRTINFDNQPSGMGSFGCGGILVGFISSDDDNRDWNGGDWILKNATSELVTASLTNPNKGGIMCCKDRTTTPTQIPTEIPTLIPTKLTNIPTKIPTNIPTIFPTLNTQQPTQIPTKIPTLNPIKNATNTPTNIPTNIPTKNPTNIPTIYPTQIPTIQTTKIETTINAGKQNLFTLEPWIYGVIIGLLVCIFAMITIVLIIYCKNKKEDKIIKANSEKIMQMTSIPKNGNTNDNGAIYGDSNNDTPKHKARVESIDIDEGIGDVNDNVTTNNGDNKVLDVLTTGGNINDDTINDGPKETNGFTPGDDDDSSIDDDLQNENTTKG